MEEEVYTLRMRLENLERVVSFQSELLEEYIDFSENKRNQSSTMYPDLKHKKLLKQLKQLRNELGL